MELFLVYLWLKLDIVIFVLYLIAFLSGLVWFVCIIASEGDVFKTDAEPDKTINKWWKRIGILCLISIMCAMLLPSSKDTAILVGSSIAIDMVKSPEGAKIGQLIRGKANEFLDSEIKKLGEKKQ